MVSVYTRDDELTGTRQVFPTVPTDSLTTEVARARADMYDFTMGETSPGPGAVWQKLVTEGEINLRRHLAMQEDIRNQQERLSLLQQYIKDYPAGVTPPQEDVEFARELVRGQTPTNPETSTEQVYAREVVNSVTSNALQDIYNQALEEDDTTTLAILGAFEHSIILKEVGQTLLDGLYSKWNDRNAIQKVLTFGETLLPFFSMENFMNETPDARTSSILPGRNIREQYEAISLMPLEEGQRMLKEVSEILAEQNLLDAIHFMEGYVNGYTKGNELMDNLLFLDWTIVGGAAFKEGRRLLRSTPEAEAPGLTRIEPRAEGETSSAVAQGEMQTSPAHLTERTNIENLTESQGLEAEIAAGVGTTPGRLRNQFRSNAELSATERLENAVRDVLEATAQPKADPSQVLAAAGETRASAIVGVIQRAVKEITRRDRTNQFGTITAGLTSLLHPSTFTRGATRLAREDVQTLLNHLENNAASLLNILSRTNNPVRLNEQAITEAAETAFQDFKFQNPSVANSILDVDGAYQTVRGGEDIANTYSIIVRVGTPDGQLFKDRDAAQVAIDTYGWRHLQGNQLTIRDQGGKSYLEYVQDIDETRPEVRAALIEGDNVTPEGWKNLWFLRFLRNPEDTLSKLHRDNRHATTHGSQNLHLFIKEVAQSMKLRKEQRENLNQLLEAMATRETPNGRGQYLRNLGEFEQEYQNLFNRLPTRKEAEAYFTFVQINDIDWAMRNLQIFRDKARKGIQNWNFSGKFFDPKGQKIDGSTGNLEGRLVTSMPWDEDIDFGVLLIDGTHGETSFLRNRLMGEGGRAEIQKKLDAGYSIIQVADPIDPQLRQVTGNFNPTHYIVAKNFKHERLPWLQIPRREGGHTEYANRWYIKQAKVRRILDDAGVPTRHIYEGDVSLRAIGTEAQAKKFAPLYDKARQLYREGKTEELEAFLSKNLPEDRVTFEGYFNDLVDPDGKVIREAILHPDDPITFTRSGQRLIDIKEHGLATSYKDFDDAIRTPLNLFEDVDKKFAGERNELLPRIKEGRGTENEPLFKLEAPKTIDPLRTLGRSIANSVRSRHFADYKIYAAESFIQEWKHLMATPPEQLARNPIYYMHNPEWIEDVPHRQQLMMAKTAQRHILNLLGTESNMTKGIARIKENLLNTIYHNLGQDAAEMVDEKLLYKIHDPARFMRAVAFHTKLGLFNPVQLFLQAQTLTHMGAIAGLRITGQAMPAASLMMAKRFTEHPQNRAHITNLATKMGWKADEFEESLTELENTGWRWVEGETAWRDDVQLNDKLVDTRFGEFLHLGTGFFRGGERITRLTAWNIAYLEWKRANPGKAITDRVRNAMLTRADDLTVNMTRASAATWQQGLMSLPTQFTSYQIRLWEQFLGHRLTWQQKLRVLGVYSAMYGIPIAAGVPFALWPVHEEIKKYFMENGMEYDDTIVEGVMEGMQSMMLELVTGEDYDVSRFGPGGLSLFKDMVQTARGQGGDKGWLDFFAGPSYTIMGDIVQSVEPVIRGVFDVFKTGENSTYPLLAQDFIDAFKEISSVNNITRAIAMSSTQRYLSENQTLLDDVTTMDGVIMAMFGVMPQEISDTFLKIESMQEFQAAQEVFRDKAIQNWRKGVMASYNGDTDTAQLYFTRARAYIVMGDFRPDQYSDLISAASQFMPDLEDRINWDWVRNAPWSQFNQRLEAFGQQNEEGR